MTNIHGLLIRPSGAIVETHVETDLASLRAAIGGGYLEGVASGDGWVAYGDEEARLKDMPENLLASFVLDIGVCGDILVVGANPPDETDIPEAWIRLAERLHNEPTITARFIREEDNDQN